MTVYTQDIWTRKPHPAPLPSKACACGSHWYRDFDGIPRQTEHDLTHEVHASIGELWGKER